MSKTEQHANTPFYISTAIPYVNSVPHMGHAMEYILTDVMARYQRMMGREVFFLTGTDEHGSKIVKVANEQGSTPKALCDKHVEVFQSMKELLQLSFDDFIRTTDQKKHWPSVITIWNKLVEQGDIYKDEYTGYYCVGCESFIMEKELEEGKCPTHKSAPEVIKEENYFFKLSKYTDDIIKLIESGKMKIVPEYRGREIINVMKEGLHDVSFSRPKSSLEWGIPVPGDDSQVMYVWCDALTNYISALDYANNGENFQKFWSTTNEKVHVIGKDILRFHAAIWPAMLISAGIPLPTVEYVHGFITTNGEKMSKSLGNVIDPVELVENYGAEALRLYIIKEIPSGQDGDITIERFESHYEADLAHNLGNLVNRVFSMTVRFDVPLVANDALKEEAEATWQKYHENFKTYDFHLAAKAVWELLDTANQYIDTMKPWALAKEDEKKTGEVLYSLNELIRQASIMLTPLLPEIAKKIRDWQSLPQIEGAINDLAKWGAEDKKWLIKKPEILFKPLDN